MKSNADKAARLLAVIAPLASVNRLQVLEALYSRKGVELTSAEISEVTGIKHNVLQNLLTGMVHRGLVMRAGNGGAKGYRYYPAHAHPSVYLFVKLVAQERK